MTIEDDLFHSFKYAGFGKKVDPTKMIRIILRNLEVSMLTQMDARIRARLNELQGAPQDVSMDPFSILGVDMNATREEIDRAYRGKARTAHPDANPDKDERESNMEMARINAAYEAIRLFKGWKVK